MKVLAALALLLSLPGSHLARPIPAPADRIAKTQARRGGRWYFAETGHAVYCYGPVRIMPQLQGGFQKVATFCQGDKPIVPLKD